MRLRLHTAGESHGPAIVAWLDGLPAGLQIDRAALGRDLARRQRGYGRGGRQKIERDEAEILSGLRGGKTLGSPLAIVVANRDHASWVESMHPWDPPLPGREDRITRPRPGHADLAGALKYGTHDVRDVLERASARSTAARVAAGAICKQLLAAFNLRVVGHVLSIGDVTSDPPRLDLDALADAAEASDVRCADAEAGARMCAAIDAARRRGDSLGGVVEVMATGVPPGLGSTADWDLRMDGRLAQAVMSIQAVKGVEIGAGFASARTPGSQVHDPIHRAEGRFVRPTNHAGGVEGGMTNGEAVIVRAAMKPIPTLARPLASVDLVSKEAFDAAKERTDSCAVPACAVVAEAAVAFVLCDAFLDKFGGDAMPETVRNYQGFMRQLEEY
ncbi:MAG: chorismate synthase [Myxococcota bacterium]